MKRSLLLLLPLLLLAFAVIAQTPEVHEAAPAEHATDNWTLWKWANFAILMAVLGFLGAKHGGPFFRARGEEIRKGIADASVEKQAADERYAEVSRRLSNLESEIASMRADAREEMNAESERIRLETEQQLAKVHQHAEQEIVSVAKAERQELRNHAASLAIELAEQRIRERISPQLQDALVAKFAGTAREGRR